MKSLMDKLINMIKERSSEELIFVINMMSMELLQRIADEEKNKNKCPHSLGDECDCTNKL